MNLSHKDRHVKLIELSGGKVEGDFVLLPGIMVTKRSSVSEEAKSLFEKMNIDTNRPEYEQHAEFNSRITYLSFKNEKSSSKEFNKKMIHEYGHRGVYNDEYVTFLIAGCSLETQLEFVAHNEATIARLTSSKTKAQNDPLYCISLDNNNADLKDYLKEIKSGINTSNPNISDELKNMLHPGIKAVSFTITMSVKNWHKTLIGRLSHHGVETEMRQIMERIAIKLKEMYPIFFNTVEEYYQLGNNAKYSE